MSVRDVTSRLLYATEPSRELDLRVFCAMRQAPFVDMAPGQDEAGDPMKLYWYPVESKTCHMSATVPFYSSGIDGALSLFSDEISKWQALKMAMMLCIQQGWPIARMPMAMCLVALDPDVFGTGASLEESETGEESPLFSQLVRRIGEFGGLLAAVRRDTPTAL